MAVITSARVNVALGAGQARGSNRSNVGLDKGMMKGFSDHIVHIEHKRLTTAGTLSGARRPYFFINPLTAEEKPAVRPNRPGTIKKLRRLEKRALWFTGLVASIASCWRSIRDFSFVRNYDDQVRCATRRRISQIKRRPTVFARRNAA